MLGGLFCSTLSAHALDYWDFVTIKSSRSNIDDPSKYTVGKLNSITGQRETLGSKIFGYNDGNAVQGLSEVQYSAATNRINFGTATASYYYDLGTQRWGLSDMQLESSSTDYNRTKYSTRHLATGEGTKEVHLGENSLITVEENGVQKLYAKDADKKAIPINITEGSKLLIDGVEVTPGDSKQVKINQKNISTNAGNIESNRQNISTNAGNIESNQKNISTNAGNIETNRKNINDLGYGVAGATALTAALSSLPTAADDTPFSCGVGTGGYSSRFAVGIGCASRLSDRLSVNVGGSHVFGGSSSYGGGSLDTVAARGGFVFKLGTIHKRSNIDGEELQSQLDELKQENSSIREENRAVRDENRAIRDENKELIARLERLEAIALGQQTEVTALSLK